MDFTKFISILYTNSIYFAKPKLLSELDPFEGNYTSVNIKDNPLIIRRLNSNFYETVGVSSWHVNEFESAAMWKLYLKNHDEGIAIQSTFKSLKESFHVCKRSVFIGLVEYIDYDTSKIPENTQFQPYMYKRKSFEHEQELRAIVSKEVEEIEFDLFDFDDGGDRIYKGPKYESFDDNGIYIPVNLDILIDKIVISPTAPKWFYFLVRSVLEQYKTGFESRVTQSKISGIK